MFCSTLYKFENPNLKQILAFQINLNSHLKMKKYKIKLFDDIAEGYFTNLLGPLLIFYWPFQVFQKFELYKLRYHLVVILKNSSNLFNI